jgi:hypothetical protein
MAFKYNTTVIKKWYRKPAVVVLLLFIVGLIFALKVYLNSITPVKSLFQPSDNMNPMDHGPFVTSTIAHDSYNE